MCVCVCACVCMCVYVCACVCMCVHVCACVCVWCVTIYIYIIYRSVRMQKRDEIEPSLTPSLYPYPHLTVTVYGRGSAMHEWRCRFTEADVGTVLVQVVLRAMGAMWRCTYIYSNDEVIVARVSVRPENLCVEEWGIFFLGWKCVMVCVCLPCVRDA